MGNGQPEKVPVEQTIIGLRLGFIIASPVMGLILGACFRQTYRFHTTQTEASSTSSQLSSSGASSLHSSGTSSLLQRTKKWRKMLREHWRVWLVTILAAFAFIILIIDNMSSIHAGRPTKKSVVKLDPAGYMIPAISGCVQMTVHSYFLGSLYGFTSSKILVGPIWFLSIVSFLGSWGRTITIAISKDLYKQSGYKGSPETQIILARTSMAMYILWLGGAVLVDLALALALSYNLKRSGFGGFKSTYSMVTKLADGFLMTFSCSALVVILTAFVFFVPEIGTSRGQPFGIGSFGFWTFIHVPTYYLSFIYTLTRRREISNELRSDQISCKLQPLDID